MSQPMNDGRDRRKSAWVAGVVLLATLARLAVFPERYEVRDVDEPGYLAGGLQLLEGWTPGTKAAPGATMYWITWAYAGVQSAHHLVRPGPEERAVPFLLRPFVAVNHAIFDNYRDLSGLHVFMIAAFVLISAAAAAAAALLGYRCGGALGAVLAGGFFALCPVFVEFTAMTRPYVLGWDFGLLAIYFATRGGVARAAVFTGLAVASRIEMLAVLPMVAWGLWDGAGAPPWRLGRPFARYVALSALVSVAVAPWLVTNMLGLIRSIVTVRFAPPPEVNLPVARAVAEVAFFQGAALALLAAAAGIARLPRGQRGRAILLLIYVLLLMAMFVRQSGFGLHQNASMFVGVVLLLAVGARGLREIAPLRRPRVMAAAVALILVLPFMMTARLAARVARLGTGDGSVAWIEQNVPAGTTVYWMPAFALRQLLPTPRSADAAWETVTNVKAWQAKLQAGMSRLGVAAEDLPRALADEHMIQDRGARRGTFILGSRPAYPAPRYDLRLIGLPLMFHVADVPGEWKRTGGVVVTRTIPGQPAPTEFGTPTAQWVHAGGVATYLYVSPNLAKPATRPATSTMTTTATTAPEQAH